MALEITPSMAEMLPTTVKSALSKMSTEDQSMFQEQFGRKCKGSGLMLILAIFFPIQLFMLGKTGLGIAYWLTGGGMGIWWVIEIFITGKRVREYNEDVATKTLTDMKIMSQ